MESAHQAKRPRIGERTLLACTGCKQRKLKCDGQSPRCQNCVKNDRECLVEDPATGLHRPRDYMQMLESHVAYLESLLQQTRPDIAGDHLNAFAASSTLREGGNAGPSGAPSQAASVALAMNEHPHLETSPTAFSGSDGHVDDLSSEVALLCLSAAGREPHYFGPSSAVSFSRIASQTMGIQHSQAPPAGASLSEERDAKAHGRSTNLPKLPLESTSSTYVRAYFANIHPQYPFLHEPTFNAWQAECTKINETYGDLTQAKAVHVFFVMMVYAIGCLTLGPAHYETAEDLYAVALDRIASVLDLDSLESVQSILCCAVYSIRSPVGASLWKVSGMAIRHCVELGYHRNAQRYRKNADVLTKEMSLRCFWVAYDIDRVAANILGRPDGISDQFIDAEYPLDINDEHITAGALLQTPRTSPTEPPTHMSGAIHVIKLRRLWSKFSTQLHQSFAHRDPAQQSTQSSTIQELRQELDDWLQSAPDLSQMSSSQPRSTFASHQWFRLAHCHSVLLLYRPFITDASASLAVPTGQNMDLQTTERAFRECHHFAKEICVLYRKLFHSPTIQLTWGGLHILFLAALTYLYCLWRSKPVRDSARRSEVVSTCMACTTVLVIIAERWPSAASYRNLFESLSERTIDMVCGDSSAGASKRPAETATATSVNETQHDNSLSQDWSLPMQDLGLPDTEGLFQELMQGICQDGDFALDQTFPLGSEDADLGFNWH